MNKQTVKKLIELNTNFYSSNGLNFDLKNKHFREGWQNINLNGCSKVIDIAAGNYRLFEYLKSINFTGGYSAIENCKDFVNFYKQNYLNSFSLFNIDAINDLKKVDNKYDLITCFGFTHHIPGFKNRVEWFKQLKDLLNPQGKIVFTTWNFDTLKNFKPKKSCTEIGVEEDELEQGDFFINWDNTGIYRYCHLYNGLEVQKILNEAGLKLDSTYSADGKNKKSNTYYIVSRK